MRFAAENGTAMKALPFGSSFLGNVCSKLSAMNGRARELEILTLADPELEKDRIFDLLAISIPVELPRSAVYNLWTTDSSLPHFMRGRQVQEVLSESRMTWRVEYRGQQVAWDGEVCDEIPYDRISWQSFHDGPCPNWGYVQFADTIDGGTQVTVGIEFESPGAFRGNHTMKALFSRLESNLERLGTMRDFDGRWDRLFEDATSH